MKRSEVAVANEVISIATVCRWLGVEVPDDPTRAKLYCPFGEFNHSDGGREPAFRIYTDSNSAYCFACSESFTPVKMYARMTDNGNWKAVALILLAKIGYRGMDPELAWRQAQQYQPEIDRSQLAEALKTYCRRSDPAWRTRQFDAFVAARLTRCLALLDLVRTEQDASLWLGACKLVMRQAITSGEPS